MIVRVVQMIFKSECIEEFREIFKHSKEAIRNSAGCSELILYQDASDPKIFFTYSIWESEKHLNAYRNSEGFEATWNKTKVLFDGKPSAWTLLKTSNIQ